MIRWIALSSFRTTGACLLENCRVIKLVNAIDGSALDGHVIASMKATRIDVCPFRYLKKSLVVPRLLFLLCCCLNAVSLVGIYPNKVSFVS